MASLILGTTFTSLWLLRSRPDQVHDECMRGDPPRAQFNKFSPKISSDLEKSGLFGVSSTHPLTFCQNTAKSTFKYRQKNY